MWYFFSRTDCSMVGLPVWLAEETGVAGFDWSLRCKGLHSMWQIRFNIMTLGARLTNPGLVFPTRRLEKSSPGLVKSKAATCETPARRSVSRLVSFLQQPSRAPVRINTCFFLEHWASFVHPEACSSLEISWKCDEWLEILCFKVLHIAWGKRWMLVGGNHSCRMMLKIRS